MPVRYWMVQVISPGNNSENLFNLAKMEFFSDAPKWFGKTTEPPRGIEPPTCYLRNSRYNQLS
jgi:hypothetical protein